MFCLDVPDEVILQVLQFLDAKEVCRVQRSSMHFHRATLKHSSQLRKLAYPIVFHFSTTSLRVTIDNLRECFESHRRIEVNNDRSRINLRVTYDGGLRQNQDKYLYSNSWPPLSAKDYLNDETVFKTFLLAALRHIDLTNLCVDAVNVSMLTIVAHLVGPRRINDGTLFIGPFSATGTPEMQFQKMHEDCLLNETLRKFTFSKLIFATPHSCEISRTTVDHWISTCNCLYVWSPKSTLDLDDEVLNGADFPKGDLNVATKISSHGLRRLLNKIDQDAKLSPDQTLGFMVKTAKPRREFFDTIIQGLSGISSVFDAKTFCNADFTMKHVVFSMIWNEEFRREEIEPGSFLYSIFMRRNWEHS